MMDEREVDRYRRIICRYGPYSKRSVDYLQEHNDLTFQAAAQGLRLVRTVALRSKGLSLGQIVDLNLYDADEKFAQKFQKTLSEITDLIKRMKTDA